MYGYTYITTIKTKRHTLIYGGKKRSAKFLQNYFGSGRVVRLIKKSGKAELNVELVGWHKTLDELNTAERKLISELRSAYGKHCVNINDGGDGFNPETSAMIENTPTLKQRRVAGITAAWKCEKRREAAKAYAEKQFANDERRRKFIEASHSSEAKKKQTETRRKLWATEEFRSKMVNGNKSPERRANVSLGQTLAWQDPEIRARRMAAMKAARDTPEFRKKLSESAKRAGQNPEVKQNRKLAQAKVWSDAETREKRIAAFKANANTPEAVAKRSAAIRAAWARRKAAS